MVLINDKWMSIDELAEKLAPLMKFREQQNPGQEPGKLDLTDMLYNKEMVEFGPRHEAVSISKYRETVEVLASFPDNVTHAFDQFIAGHTNLNSRQLEFLRLLKNFIVEREKVEKRDLIQSPFTIIHPQGIRGVFKPAEIDEILHLTEQLAA